MSCLAPALGLVAAWRFSMPVLAPLARANADQVNGLFDLHRTGFRVDDATYETNFVGVGGCTAAGGVALLVAAAIYLVVKLAAA